MYDLLKKRRGNLDEKAFYFHKIFPKKKVYNDAQFRGILSDFSKAIRAFLSHQELKNNANTQQQLLINSYKDRGHYLAFEKEVEAFDRNLEKAGQQNFNYYLNQFSIHRLLYFHPQTKKIQSHVKSLTKLIDSLDKFIAIAKLQIACELRVRTCLLYTSPSPRDS